MGKLKAAIILASTVALTGCAAQIRQAAEADCASYGITPQSLSYSDCIERRVARREDRIMQAAMPRGGGSMGQSSGATAYLRSQYVQGTSRVCTYDRMGSPYVVTVGSAELCPITTN